MGILRVLLLIILLTISSVCTTFGQDGSLFANATADQIVTLFPAQNLERFEVYSWKRLQWKPNKDPNHVFKLQDGFLRASGAEVLYLTTNRSFYNYHLIAEYKWLNATTPRDSGIFVNATPSGSAIMAFECNIAAAPSKAPLFGLWGLGPTRQLIVDGKKIFHIPRTESVDFENPVGEWNRVEIICDHDRFYFGINSHEIVTGTNPVPRSGSIMFQHNKGDILFGRVEIVDYDSLSREEAAKARRWQNNMLRDGR